MNRTLRALAGVCLLAWISVPADTAQSGPLDSVLVVWGRCNTGRPPLAPRRTQRVPMERTLCAGVGEAFVPLSWAVPRVVARASLLDPEWRRLRLPLLASAACDCLTHVEASAFVSNDSDSGNFDARIAHGVGTGPAGSNGSIPVVVARVAHCARGTRRFHSTHIAADLRGRPSAPVAGTEGAMRRQVSLTARATHLPRDGDHTLTRSASHREDEPTCPEPAAGEWDTLPATPAAPVPRTGNHLLLVAVVEGRRPFMRQASALLRSLAQKLPGARGFREAGAVLLLALPGVPAALMDRCAPAPAPTASTAPRVTCCAAAASRCWPVPASAPRGAPYVPWPRTTQRRPRTQTRSGPWSSRRPRNTGPSSTSTRTRWCAAERAPIATASRPRARP